MNKRGRHWSYDAECEGMNPDLFVGPDHVETMAERQLRRRIALAVCKECPVVRECLEAAYAEGDFEAIRGGTTGATRRRIAERTANTA